MPFGLRRGYSDNLHRRHIENLRAAVHFTAEIGHPLTLSIDINWTRTSLGDDPDGKILDKLMELSRKWLKRQGVGVFAQIEVRENPDCPTTRANAHIMLHCPRPLVPAFKTHFRRIFTRLCGRPHGTAAHFCLVGHGNPTLAAALGKLNYLSKGVDPETARQLGITPEPQGRVYGKRVSISQDINHAARRRYELSKAPQRPNETNGQIRLQEDHIPELRLVTPALVAGGGTPATAAIPAEMAASRRELHPNCPPATPPVLAS